MASKTRVVVIGLDGLNIRTIQPLIKNGKLPVLEKVLSQSAYAHLTTQLPFNAASGWTSLMTGKNPEQHTILEFYDKTNGTYHRPVISSDNVKAKRIWDILGEHNRKSIVMNVPVTFPPNRINGVLVSGMLSRPDAVFTYPADLSENLRKDGYIIDVLGHYRPNLTGYMELALQTIIYRQQAFLKLLHNNDWDFATIAFTTVDRLQSAIWDKPDSVEKIFMKLDSLIGEIIEEIDNGNTSIIFLSNYGYTDISKKFFVNEWLSELGLLSREISTNNASIPNFMEDYFGQASKKRSLFAEFLAKSGITKDNIRAVLPEMICEMIKKTIPAPIRKMFPRENLIINWNKTKAWSPSEFIHGIRINVKGREPEGIVEPGWKYEHVRNTIISELYRLKDPHTFENIIERVYRREEIFDSDNEERAPDILFVLKDFKYTVQPNKRTNRHFIGTANDDYPVRSGPDPNGMIMIVGPSIKSGIINSDMAAVDVAPTIFHLLDVQIPDDLTGVFPENFITASPENPTGKSISEDNGNSSILYVDNFQNLQTQEFSI